MNLLLPFRFHTLLHPYALLLIPAVALLLIAEWTARAPGVMHVSTGETLSAIRGGRGVLMRNVPTLLRAMGLILLIVALARPLQGLAPKRETADVIDIMLCVDVSQSMATRDFVGGGRALSRLDVTKDAVHRFIGNRKLQAGDRYGLDRVGLIFYARYAWTQCPLTLDYGVLERELMAVRADDRDPKRNNTAIGSAVGLAVSKLKDSEAKSKVIILLTDGLNNAGELDPLTAARFAAEYGIRVYTIGAGSNEGGRQTIGTLFGRIGGAPPIDEETLRQIAKITDGEYYRASDTGSLEESYARISELERTQVEFNDYYEYEEGFVPWAALGAIVLAISVFSRRVWFEPIP